MSTQQINFREMPDDELKDLLKSQCLPLFQRDYMDVEGCVMPVSYKKIINELLDFEVRDDDVYVCSFPKCGTTWTQEMVWCIANDLDFETAKKVDINNRFPFIELAGKFAGNVPIKKNIECISNSLEFTKNFQGRRFIKTHMPFHLLPRQLQSDQCKAKIVYVARDVRDTCISYYHHHRAIHGFIGSFDTFFKLFINDRVMYAPYWMNILGFWNIRNQPNVLFIHYEDMKKDLSAVIRKVAIFFDKTFSSDQVASLAEHLSFENMKNNPAVNKEHSLKAVKALTGSDFNFLREGLSGGHVKVMTVSQIEALTEWSKNHIKNTDYQFL